jgi:hypothetical protein
VGFPAQKPRLALVYSAIIAREDLNAPVTVWVSLEGSSVNPGLPLQDDRDDARGYFQDQVDVTMSIGTDAQPSVDYFVRTSDGPATYSGGGSVSSSVSVSVSGNLSVGFFGGTPTGNASVGGSVTETHSFSNTLADFEVANDSSLHDNLISHSYRMSKSDGAAYSEPEDLVPQQSFTGAFKGVQLYKPPPLAVNDLPILSQAIWQSTDSARAMNPHRLFVRVRQRLVWVTATNKFFSIDKSHLTALSDWSDIIDLPLDHRDVSHL